MPEFLSPEWVASLDRAARDWSPTASGADGGQVIIEQRVEQPDGTEHAHHVVLGSGSVRVRAGRAERPDLVVHTDLATAVDLARGRTNAQEALTQDRLHVHGDVNVLLAHAERLDALDDVFGVARHDTTFACVTDDSGASRARPTSR